MGEEGRNFEQEIAERAAKEKNLCCLCCLLFEQNLVLISKIATIERLRAVCPVSRLTYEACMGYFFPSCGSIGLLSTPRPTRR